MQIIKTGVDIPQKNSRLENKQRDRKPSHSFQDFCRLGTPTYLQVGARTANWRARHGPCGERYLQLLPQRYQSSTRKSTQSRRARQITTQQQY